MNNVQMSGPYNRAMKHSLADNLKRISHNDGQENWSKVNFSETISRFYFIKTIKFDNDKFGTILKIDESDIVLNLKLLYYNSMKYCCGNLGLIK